MEVSLGSIILESVIEFDINGGRTISYNEMFRASFCIHMGKNKTEDKST